MFNSICLGPVTFCGFFVDIFFLEWNSGAGLLFSIKNLVANLSLFKKKLLLENCWIAFVLILSTPSCRWQIFYLFLSSFAVKYNMIKLDFVEAYLTWFIMVGVLLAIVTKAGDRRRRIKIKFFINSFSWEGIWAESLFNCNFPRTYIFEGILMHISLIFKMKFRQLSL